MVWWRAAWSWPGLKWKIASASRRRPLGFGLMNAKLLPPLMRALAPEHHVMFDAPAPVAYLPIRLRKGTGQEDITGSLATARADKEYHVLPALELCSRLPELLFAINWVPVDLEYDVATLNANIIGKRIRLHVGHQHAPPSSDSQLIGLLLGKRTHGNAQFRGAGLTLVGGFVGC